MPQLDISTFTGRKNELKQLEESLLYKKGEKVCSIVGLTGGGGIGKSALASHFATINKDKFPDGVVGLRVENKDVNTIAREFARQIGKPIDPDDEIEAGAIMQKLFAPRRMLLIFDNVEEASIKVLRPGGNRCAVIVTTRNQNLPFSLDVSESATIRLRSLPENDALDLLRKILGKDRIDTALKAAQRVAKVVGRLPLALQVVGAALRGKPRPLESYADSLQSQKDQLKLLHRLRVRGDKEFNVEASLNLSLELLEEKEIDFFASLSVCAEEGFARKTAMAATGFKDEWEAQEFLERLYELSLLNYAETGQNRFVLHPLVREYAKSLAQERNLRTISEERHAKFFVEWLQSESLEDKTVVAEIAANLDDIILAVECLQNTEAEVAQKTIKNYQFALQLQPLFEQYGYWIKAITLMTRFQSWAEQFQDWNAVVNYKMHEARYWSFEEEFGRAEEILYSSQNDLPKINYLNTRKRSEAKVLNVLAGIYQKQGKIEDAVQTFRLEIPIAYEIGDYRSLSIVYNRLGKLLQSQGKLQEAQQAFEREIVIDEELNDRSSLAIGLNCLGGVLQQQGKLNQAQQAFEREIAIDKELNDRSSLAIGLNRLGGVLKQQGKLEEAQQAFEREIAIDKELNDQFQLAIGLNCLGGVLKQQGELELAQKAFGKRVAISEELNDQSQLAIGLNCLGRTLQQQGKLEEAQQAFEREIAIDKELNDQFQLAIGLNCLGGVLKQQGELELAQKAFEKRVAIAEELNDQSQLVIGLNCLVEVFQQQGKLEEAQQAFEREIAINEDINDQSSQLAWTLHNLGRIWKKKGGFEKAELLLKQSQEIFENNQELTGLAKVMNTLGGVLERQQKWKKAEKILRQSYDLALKLKDKKGQAIIANSLGQVKAHQKGHENFERSQMYFRHSIKLGQELNDRQHLAKVHTAMGQSYLAHRDFEKAVDELSQGFKIDESLSNIRGLRIVTPNLTYALIRLGKRDEALKYCHRALEMFPNHSNFLRLRDKIQTAISTGIQQGFIKTGVILYIRYSKKDKLHWGKIVPDDGSPNITFNDKFVDSETKSKLTKGTLVEVEVKEKREKLYASHIVIIEDEEEYF